MSQRRTAWSDTSNMSIAKISSNHADNYSEKTCTTWGTYSKGWLSAFLWLTWSSVWAHWLQKANTPEGFLSAACWHHSTKSAGMSSCNNSTSMLWGSAESAVEILACQHWTYHIRFHDFWNYSCNDLGASFQSGTPLLLVFSKNTWISAILLICKCYMSEVQIGSMWILVILITKSQYGLISAECSCHDSVEDRPANTGRQRLYSRAWAALQQIFWILKYSDPSCNEQKLLLLHLREHEVHLLAPRIIMGKRTHSSPELPL